MQHLSASMVLARALKLPALPEPPGEIPDGSVCEVWACGQPITRGYARGQVISDATGEYLDALRGNTRWVCEECARVLKASSPHGNYAMGRAWLAFEDGTAWDPMIARESAEKGERACWSALAREVWPARRGQRCVVLLTTDGKKRTWPKALTGALGSRTPVCYHNTGGGIPSLLGSENVWVDWERLVGCLDAVEPVYSLGFAKGALAEGLLRAFTTAQAVGLRETRRLDAELAAWRGTPEFRVALLLAQKVPGSEPAKAPKPARAAKEKRASMPAAPEPAVSAAPAGQLALF